VAALKAHPKPINSAAEALKVRGVGKSIAEKVRLHQGPTRDAVRSPSTYFRAQIGEIIETGKLRKAEATDELAETMAIFSKIWGTSHRDAIVVYVG
jgi:hypothetical protein